MNSISHFFYNLGITLYGLSIRIAGLFNPKAKLWVAGRKGNQFPSLPKGKKGWIWFHCASLGEFEQARPLIDRCFDENQYAVLLTFFSPSGYEIRKDYQRADYVRYMSLDTPKKARRWVQNLEIKLAVFVKYEIWCNHIIELQSHDVPAILIAGVFRDDQVYFRFYAPIFRRALNAFSHCFVQDEASLKLLNTIDQRNTSIGGDPRFDRTMSIARETLDHEVLSTWAKGRNVLVAGSTWPADEDLLNRLFENDVFSDWSLLIAPHEVDSDHVQKILAQYGDDGIALTRLSEQNVQKARIVVVDSIGLLSKLYRLGALAYVGGGFGVSIHNILEATAYGIPVMFGPNNRKSREAQSVKERGVGREIRNETELIAAFKHFSEETKDKAFQTKILDYMESECGGTEEIWNWMQERLR